MVSSRKIRSQSERVSKRRRCPRISQPFALRSKEREHKISFFENFFIFVYDYTSNNAGGTRRIKYDKILSYFTLLGANKILRNISTRLLFIREFFLYAKYGSSVLNLKIIKNYRVYTYECLKKIRFFPIIIYIYSFFLSFTLSYYRSETRI